MYKEKPTVTYYISFYLISIFIGYLQSHHRESLLQDKCIENAIYYHNTNTQLNIRRIQDY